MAEVQALKKLNNSPFLIKIKEMVHNKKENEVNIVFEYCEKNLYHEMQERSRRNNLFSEPEIKNIMY
jgi:serine/threonine protein kinase